MATITEYEKKFIKGMFEHYKDQYSGQEILGIVNDLRGNPSNHINIGRISEVKKDCGIPVMSKEEVDKWLKNTNGYLKVNRSRL